MVPDGDHSENRFPDRSGGVSKTSDHQRSEGSDTPGPTVGILHLVGPVDMMRADTALEFASNIHRHRPRFCPMRFLSRLSSG